LDLPPDRERSGAIPAARSLRAGCCDFRIARCQQR
jgi:hypothetical protein